MGVNLRLFYVLQLVCEGHLRSFTGKTCVRLWNTLACASESLFKLTVMLTRCLYPAWQFLIGFAEDAHARHSSNKFDFYTRSTISFLTDTVKLLNFCFSSQMDLNEI